MSSRGSSNACPSRARLAVAALAVVFGLTLAGCASSQAVPRPIPSPGGAADGMVAPVSGDALALTALTFRGVPYRLGGTDPSGFDCSGLVQYVLARHGVAVPRVVDDQFRIGWAVKGRARRGDLVFFRIEGRTVSHVGIALGDDTFVHAPKERGTVRVESLEAPYWARRYAGARRVSSS